MEQCEPFMYSGCDGNENNFPSLNECSQTCGKTHYLYTYQILQNYSHFLLHFSNVKSLSSCISREIGYLKNDNF